MDTVVPEMRERLEQNRYGKLTPGQWVDMILQPLGAVFAIMVPLGFVLLPRFVALMARGGWILTLVLIVIFLAVALFRAVRYARMPLHFAEMTAERNAPPLWAFWQPLALHHTEKDFMYRFRKRLSPRPLVERDRLYLVYYLLDHDEPILLSIAPVDHPDADLWQPTRTFITKGKRT